LNAAQRQSDFAHAVNRSLPESALDLALIAAPVSRQQSILHMAVEAAVRPVANPSDITVLHRIEVDVIDMTLEVGIVSDCVLPKPSLPIPVSRLRTWLLDLNCAGGSTRENPLLIWLQRLARSASPGGRVQMAWRWSGKMQMAFVVNGRRA
jgi:hypothetical protein